MITENAKGRRQCITLLDALRENIVHHRNCTVQKCRRAWTNSGLCALSALNSSYPLWIFMSILMVPGIEMHSLRSAWN